MYMSVSQGPAVCITCTCLCFTETSSLYYMYMSVLQGPAVYCPLCEKEGHFKHSCPEELLPELVPIPKMTKSHKEMLSTLLKRIPSKFRFCCC